MTDPVKSAGLFFIDNQQTWPKEAELVGDLVLWRDEGKYPAATPIVCATHPSFDGKVIAVAGNFTLVISLCPGAKTLAECRTQLSDKKRPVEQYRIAIESIIHRIMIHRAAAAGTDNAVHPFALLKWMANAAPAEAHIIKAALELLLKCPGEAATATMEPGEVFLHCEQMIQQLSPAPQDPPK